MTYAAPPVLRTPRLTLRPLQKDDADALARGVGNFDVSKWLAVVPYPYGVEDAHAFIARVKNHPNPFWAICDDAGVQGVVSLDDELAFWLARTAWGRGIGFEAAHAVVDYWFSEPENGDLASGFFEGNVRSGRLLRALGFKMKDRVTRYARSFQQDVVSNQMILKRQWWEERQDFTLYTPRLTLRPLNNKDARAFATMMVPEVTRNLGKLATGMTIDEVLADLPRRTWRGLPGFTAAIETQGQFIGTLGFGGQPSIGYFLGPDFWGQGYMSEALAAFLPAIFERFPIMSLYADHFEDNPASGAVLRKFGFEKTGREMGTSKARLEPAPLITYALKRERLRVPL